MRGLLKSTARRHTFSKNILLSSARDFYECSRKQQVKTDTASGKNEPSVHMFFFEAKEVNQTNMDIQYSSKVLLLDENYLNANHLGSCFYCTQNSMNLDRKDQQQSVWP